MIFSGIDWHVFLNSLLSGLLFIFQDEYLYKTALQYNNQVLHFTLIAISGFIIASCINYYGGLLIRRFSSFNFKENNCTKFLIKFSFLILLFLSSIIYIGPTICLLFGYLHFNIYKFIFLVTASKILYSIIYFAMQ